MSQSLAQTLGALRTFQYCMHHDAALLRQLQLRHAIQHWLALPALVRR
jgi:hypothetical protein